MAITKAAAARRAEREATIARHQAKSEGARNRWEGDQAEALSTRQRAAAAVNGPAGLARRLAKQWPDLDDGQRPEVRAILAEAGVMPSRELHNLIEAAERLANWHADLDRDTRDLVAAGARPRSNISAANALLSMVDAFCRAYGPRPAPPNGAKGWLPPLSAERGTPHADRA